MAPKKYCEWHPVDNFRACVVSRPPLVVFTMCLLMIPVAFVFTGMYVTTHEVENPDISWDWNVLLLKLARENLCVTNQVEPPPAKHSNYSMAVWVNIDNPAPAFFRQNITKVTTSMSASTLGLKGHHGNDSIRITMYVPRPVNGSENPVEVRTCVEFSAPEDMFPTRPLPAACINMPEFSSGGGIGAGSQPLKAVNASRQCNAQDSRVTFLYQQNSNLTVMLTYSEKELVYMHLVYSSYFMFAMVLLVFIYSLVRTKSSKCFGWLSAANTKGGLSV